MRILLVRLWTSTPLPSTVVLWISPSKLTVWPMVMMREFSASPQVPSYGTCHPRDLCQAGDIWILVLHIIYGIAMNCSWFLISMWNSSLPFLLGLEKFIFMGFPVHRLCVSHLSEEDIKISQNLKKSNWDGAFLNSLTFENSFIAGIAFPCRKRSCLKSYFHPVISMWFRKPIQNTIPLPLSVPPSNPLRLWASDPVQRRGR